MRNEHLSEEELQIVAMEQQLTDAGLIQHIETCISCREQIAVYKLLFTDIYDQPAPAFDFDLANSVLQQLQPAATKKASRNIRPFIIAAFVAVPLYLFRNNFLHLATGISSGFLLLSVIACISIIIIKAIKMYHTYQQKIEKLNFSK